MKVSVEIDGKRFALALEANGDGVRYTFAGEQGEEVSREASLVEVEPLVYSVLLDGRSYDVTLEPSGGALSVTLRGHCYEVRVHDPRRRGKQEPGLHPSGRMEVRAPMPGKVIRLLVEPGQEVEAGQGLAVVEAMKMQNEMKAPKAGRVAALAAREGATVAAGDVLAVIE